MLPWSNTSGIRLLSGTMQVELLPAAPLPGGVKVARRPVKPLVLVRVQVWQPISGCNVSSRRPPSEGGGRECNSLHPDHFGWLAEQQCPGPENRVSLRAAWVQSLHHPPISKPLTKGNSMRSTIRYQSQLLFRKSYKRNRLIRLRPMAKPSVTFRPVRRFGLKPQLELVS